MKPGWRKIFIPALFTLCIAGIIYAVNKQPGTTAAHPQAIDSCKTSFPHPRGFISDFVEIFTEKESRQLHELISQHEKETGNQIAIVTVDSIMLGNCSLEEYITALGNAWGVGQKTRNNGVIIGIAPALRKITIRTGLGIESIMTDAETQEIIDSSIIPFFREAKYFEGTKSGLIAIFKQIK